MSGPGGSEPPARTGVACALLALATLLVGAFAAEQSWIDLAVARSLYLPPGQFLFAGDPVIGAVRRLANSLALPVILGALALGLWSWRRRRAVLGVDPRRAAFVVLALALGPGLVVNALLKEHIGRARPAQLEIFGGDARFTPAWTPSDQCATNCSFVSGDVAAAAAMLAPALLVAVRWRALAIGAVVALTTIVAIARMTVGAHFLSDVVTAALLTWTITTGLHWLIVERRGAAPPGGAG